MSFDRRIDECIDEKQPKRILIVYGGVDGIEAAIEADEKFKVNKIEDVIDLVCQSDDAAFGSRSIRLEVVAAGFIAANFIGEYLF